MGFWFSSSVFYTCTINIVESHWEQQWRGVPAKPQAQALGY